MKVIALNYGFLLFALFLMSACAEKNASPNMLFEYSDNYDTRWASGENRTGEKGAGAKENNGAKGHPADGIAAGGSFTLLDVQGQGIIHRIWITINDRSPEMLRSLKLEMFWDGAAKPAVAVPLADFFGMGLGRMTKFESELFASPEGRSFNSFVPMPFRKSARIVITNESSKRLTHLFYDVDYNFLKRWNNDFLYFHAWWSRDTATKLARDFELLPAIKGKGRFLGTNVGVNANDHYKKSWWGEGEVRMFLDNDNEHPTLSGTGTEDYIGTAWGQGKFANRFTGCLVADDTLNQWTFYRYHVPDPVYFSSGIRVTLQQMGGNTKSVVAQMQQDSVALIPVAIDNMDKGKFIHLYEKGKVTDLKTADLPDFWTNFYRSDDVSATVYFYLDATENGLPGLQRLAVRTANMRDR